MPYIIVIILRLDSLLIIIAFVFNLKIKLEIFGFINL
jgi:hypothetical protein